MAPAQSAKTFAAGFWGLNKVPLNQAGRDLERATSQEGMGVVDRAKSLGLDGAGL